MALPGDLAANTAMRSPTGQPSQPSPASEAQPIRQDTQVCAGNRSGGLASLPRPSQDCLRLHAASCESKAASERLRRHHRDACITLPCGSQHTGSRSPWMVPLEPATIGASQAHTRHAHTRTVDNGRGVPTRQ